WRLIRLHAPQLIQNCGVFERRHVLSDFLAASDGLQQAAHDFARARLGKIVCETDVIGLGNRTELLGNPVAQLLYQGGGVAGWTLAAAYHERKHRLALDLVRLADHGGLGDARVRDQSRLDLHGTQTMSRDIEHIVDAPHDPVVAVLVAVCAVAGHVVAVVEFLPIRGDVAVVVAPDGTQHGRPGLPDDEVAARIGTRNGLALLINDIDIDSRQRLGARARLGIRHSRQRGNHDGAGLRLPPGVHDRTALGADGLVIPDPRFRIDRLADTAQQAQPRQIVLRRQL